MGGGGWMAHRWRDRLADRGRGRWRRYVGPGRRDELTQQLHRHDDRHRALEQAGLQRPQRAQMEQHNAAGDETVARPKDFFHDGKQ
jgi:hypothetical protein